MKAEDEDLSTEAVPPANGSGAEVKEWPGWPGYNVFRLIVSLLKAKSIIGRKGGSLLRSSARRQGLAWIIDGPIGVHRIPIIRTVNQQVTELMLWKYKKETKVQKGLLFVVSVEGAVLEI
ncbi:hypothetical protein OPV22_027145 [Ensete ventricosum]|uniref:Uncharacterized protein n=1 Tax=Ensete ventricosum TaxID=4639 RepID=A0AAV8Q305_ENSVE|nr:hypothetical protein OPV22_027145 [Ensete ventricosum]